MLLRGTRGVEIELILDAIGHNLQKIADRFKIVPKIKIKQTLALAAQMGF